MLKHQQFKNSKNNKIEQKGSKHQHLDRCNNKEENNLEKDGYEVKKDKYVLLFFIFFPLFP